MNRREFLKISAAAGLAAALNQGEVDAGTPSKTPFIPRRTLGRTGERLSIVGFGGIVLCGNDQQSANRIVQSAVDHGINYFDVAPSYGNGEAEERMGPALEPHRKKVFLACKTEKRDRAGAQAALQTTLKRLRTDHVDLYQLHGLTTVDEVKQALGPGGAIETFREAREKGQVRFLGFSAHSVEAAFEAMDDFHFDTILFPFNWVCFFQGNFGPQVIKKAQEHVMGILSLKAMARTPWPEGVEHNYPKCWYQPVINEEEAALALRFTLSQPITAAVPPGDERLFNIALSVAEKFKSITEKEREELKKRSEGLKPIFRYPASS